MTSISLQQKVRIYYLSLISLLLFACFIYSIFSDNKSKTRSAKDYSFPGEIESLSLKSSKSTIETIPKKDLGESARNHYIGTQNGSKIKIESIYFVKTGAELRQYVSNYINQEESALVDQNIIEDQKDGGYYSLYQTNEKTVLTSCINPHGKPTVTNRQFVTNRSFADVRIERLIPWLFNQIPLKDERCLWTYMYLESANTYNKNSQDSKSELQKMWSKWRQVWESSFPTY